MQFPNMAISAVRMSERHTAACAISGSGRGARQYGARPGSICLSISASASRTAPFGTRRSPSPSDDVVGARCTWTERDRPGSRAARAHVARSASVVARIAAASACATDAPSRAHARMRSHSCAPLNALATTVSHALSQVKVCSPRRGRNGTICPRSRQSDATPARGGGRKDRHLPNLASGSNRLLNPAGISSASWWFPN